MIWQSAFVKCSLLGSQVASQVTAYIHMINDFYLKIYTGDRSFACIHVASHIGTWKI